MREAINGNSGIIISDSAYSNEKVIEPTFIFERKLIEEGIQSKDINYTLSGVYYLDKVDSSIRAVFPLNSTFKLNVDSPSLLLNLKERMFFPLDGNETKKTYLHDVQRYDKYNEPIEHESVSFKYENTDDYIGQYITTYVHKPIAETVNSLPIYEEEFGTSNYVTETIKAINNKPVLKIERAKAVSDLSLSNTESDFKNFIMGPYTSNTICYRKFDAEGNYIFKNAEKPLNFWFKFKDSVYNLYEIINGKVNGKSFTQLAGVDKLLYQSYLSEKFSNNLGGNGSRSFEITLDLISKKTKETDPDGIERTCNFVGLNYKSSVIKDVIFSNSSNVNKFYVKEESSFIEKTSNLIEEYFNNERSISLLNGQNFYYSNINGYTLYTPLSGFFINSYNSVNLENNSSGLSALFFNYYRYSVTETFGGSLICPANAINNLVIKNRSRWDLNFNRKISNVSYNSYNYTYDPTSISDPDEYFSRTFTGYDSSWAEPQTGVTYRRISTSSYRLWF